MKYSDGFFQDLMRITPYQPVRSKRQVEALIERYEMDEADINMDFLIGFQHAVAVIGEKLREER